MCDIDLLTTTEETAADDTAAKRYIYVMLLRYPDRFSRTWQFFSRSKFSHASIGISDTDWVFFSYVLKGFRTELPRKHPRFKSREIPCELYRVEISEDVYENAKTVLDEHIGRSHSHKFSYFGLLLCYCRIRRQLTDRYFCSQFVSEILEKSKAVTLSKHYSLYLPDDFMQMNGLELVFSGNLSQLVEQSSSASLTFVEST